MAAGAPAASDFDDFMLRNPGPCVRAGEPLMLRWEAGQRAFAGGAYTEATSAFLAVAEGCPADASARHMAALSALASGEPAQAIRLFVRAERLPGADARVAFALAAAHTNATDEASAIGWLKRGLARAAPAERPFWVTRPAFARLWNNRAPAFLALLEEFDLPTDATEAAFRSKAPPPDSPPAGPPPEASGLRLQLSYFDPAAAAMDKIIYMKRQIEINMIKRIRVDEADVEEPWAFPEGEEMLEKPQEP